MSEFHKPIRMSGHAREQIGFRGASEDEVVEAIRTEVWQPAEMSRWECRKSLPFNDLWNGVRYSAKQIRPIFVDEEKEIVVITVYVYYF